MALGSSPGTRCSRGVSGTSRARRVWPWGMRTLRQPPMREAPQIGREAHEQQLFCLTWDIPHQSAWGCRRANALKCIRRRASDANRRRTQSPDRGFGLPDDRVHWPNEKFDLHALHKGTRTAAVLYECRGLPEAREDIRGGAALCLRLGGTLREEALVLEATSPQAAGRALAPPPELLFRAPPRIVRAGNLPHTRGSSEGPPRSGHSRASGLPL
jgi:hypothetical protein